MSTEEALNTENLRSLVETAIGSRFNPTHLLVYERAGRIHGLRIYPRSELGVLWNQVHGQLGQSVIGAFDLRTIDLTGDLEGQMIRESPRPKSPPPERPAPKRRKKTFDIWWWD